MTEKNEKKDAMLFEFCRMVGIFVYKMQIMSTFPVSIFHLGADYSLDYSLGRLGRIVSWVAGQIFYFLRTSD